MGIKDFFDRIRGAGGPEDESKEQEQPFNWEPTSAAPGAPAPGAPPGMGPGWRRPGASLPPRLPGALPRPGAAPSPPPHPPAPPLAVTPATAPVPQPAPVPPAPPVPAAPQVPAIVGLALPADVPDLSRVYDAAGVHMPPHGYGVDRVSQMLNHKSLAGLDRQVKAAAVLAALDAAGVPVQDVVQDAFVRYKALLAFEAAKDLETVSLRPRNLRIIEELEKEVAEFQKRKNAEMDALTRETNAAVQALFRLKQRARGEEDRMYRAVALLIEPMPARVLPMGPKPIEMKLPSSEPKPGPDLRLVESKPTPPAVPPGTAAAPAKPAAPPASGAATTLDPTIVLEPAEPEAPKDAPKPPEGGKA